MNNNLVKIRIRQIYAGLRPSEQKVADYILQYEGKASKLLMETVAQETGVSQPTVIRFVKACFLASNFPHFHRYDSLKSALYIHAVSKNINTFPKN